MNILERLFEKHKFVRRAIVVWACWLITIVMLRVTEPGSLPYLSASVAAVVATIVGVLATVLGFYQWSRDTEDKGK